jgi:hypothetical protein
MRYTMIADLERADLAPARVLSNLMGRAGIEPATLGLKVDPACLAWSRGSWQGGIRKRNLVCLDRADRRNLVDLVLTYFVFNRDNRPRPPATRRLPLLSVRLSLPPFGNTFPAGGLCEMTRPFFTFAE